jgi:hypothetical protein
LSSISWRMLSPLMSIRLWVSNFTTRRPKVSPTRVNKLALSMQVVECKENLHQARLEEIFSESMARVAIEKIPKTLPHGLLNETVMVASGARNSKYIQGCSHMDMARMRRIALIQMLVNLKLVPIRFFACINFQSHVLMRSDSISLVIA